MSDIVGCMVGARIEAKIGAGMDAGIGAMICDTRTVKEMSTDI